MNWTLPPLVPGPRGNWEAWKEFHGVLVEFLHEEDVLLMFTHYCDWPAEEREQYPVPRPKVEESPWCNGACNMLATVLTLWINDHDRVERWMLARRERAPKGQGGGSFRIYNHTLISYRSDVLGRIYFDGLFMFRDPTIMARKWGGHHLRRVDKTMLNHMNNEYAVYPDKEKAEKLVTWLNHMFGHWPKARPFRRPMPWDNLEGLFA